MQIRRTLRVTESELLQRIRLALGRTVTLFRNNVGQAWIGEIHRRGQEMWIHNPRPLQAGLCRGSADLIGWRRVTVTPEMVGSNIAVFTAIEVKTPRGRVSEEQQAFIDALAADGGIAVVARSVDDALAGVEGRG